MPNQSQIDGVYLANAFIFSTLSKARRKKVGAVLLTKNNVTLPGYNGTPAGTCNVCENYTEGKLVTKPEVIHAELNAILKAAKEGIDVQGSSMYITLSPCLPCAAMMLQAGVKRVVYAENYRDDSGVSYLLDNGVTVDKIQTQLSDAFLQGELHDLTKEIP